MTPAEPAGSAGRISHPFPLCDRDRAQHAVHPLRATATAFALHLTAAQDGLPLRPGVAVARPATDPHAALRRASQEFEAAFVRQLLSAMRASVPHENIAGGNNPGEEMYTAMLDDRLASVAARRSHRGLGDAMYRQLSTHLSPEPAAATRSDR